MNKTTEIKYEIFGEVLRKAKNYAEIAIAIKDENENLETCLEHNDEEGKQAILYKISDNECMVYDLLNSLLQNLGTLEDLQELLRNSYERDLSDLEFELNHNKKEEK